MKINFAAVFSQSQNENAFKPNYIRYQCNLVGWSFNCVSHSLICFVGLFSSPWSDWHIDHFMNIYDDTNHSQMRKIEKEHCTHLRARQFWPTLFYSLVDIDSKARCLVTMFAKLWLYNKWSTLCCWCCSNCYTTDNNDQQQLPLILLLLLLQWIILNLSKPVFFWIHKISEKCFEQRITFKINCSKRTWNLNWLKCSFVKNDVR